MQHHEYAHHLFSDYRNQAGLRDNAREKLSAMFASSNVEVRVEPWRSHGGSSEGEVRLLVDGKVRMYCTTYAQPDYDRKAQTTVWFARIPNTSVEVGPAEYDERDADADNPRDYTRAKARKVAEKLAEEHLRAGFEKLRQEFARAEALAAAKAASTELAAANEVVAQLNELLRAACAKRDAVVKALEAEVNAAITGTQGAKE